MKRSAVVLSSLALLAAGGTETAAAASPSLDAAGVRRCSDTSGATYIRARRLNCRRARQVAQYWEGHGFCQSGWRFSRAGTAPDGVGTGGSLLRCTKRGTKQSVTWVESGE